MYAHRVRPVIRVINVCSESLTCNLSVQCMFREFELSSESNTCVKSGFSVCSETSTSIHSYFIVFSHSLTIYQSDQCMLTELDL